MKNESTSSTKGVPWGSAVRPAKEGYNQVGGESHKAKGAEKFCGPTKGNTDLPPDRSSGVSTGHGGGQHKAGGGGGY